MIKNIILLLTVAMFGKNMLFGQVTGIYTDFGGYWHSTSASPNTTRPNNSHNLLAFTWNGTTYSTGVNDAVLSAHTVTFTAQQFQALPVSRLPNLILNGTGSTNVIGVGSLYGGTTNIPTPPVITNDVASYLIDGPRGLDISTGIFNMPVSSEIDYTIAQIQPAAIGDGIPDIVITQIGQPASNSSDFDLFRFSDADGYTVGTTVSVYTGGTGAPVLGQNVFKFFNPTSSGNPAFNSGLGGNRDIRLLAYDFSAFGITAADIPNIKNFVQKFSGQSDQAFIAYNTTSIILLQPVSGTVFVDRYGGVPDGTPYEGATVELRDAANTVIATTTTSATGFYSFPNLQPGNYTVTLQVPGGYHITSSADGGTDPNLSANVTTEPVTGRNFGIWNPALPVVFGDIDAVIRNNRLFVDWQTHSETGNSYFEVELSRDGTTFVKGGTVKSLAGNGHSDKMLNYSFSLEFAAIPAALGLMAIAALGLGYRKKYALKRYMPLAVLLAVFYLAAFSSCSKTGVSLADENTKLFVRIRQVDIDGSFKYSKTVQVSVR